MKKRKVKDFIALYASEDEEKLVLIQSGASADKTFLDTFWTANIRVLAMADARTGQVVSGCCYLSWPFADNEREAGEYARRFVKGKVYRIRARGWKGDALSEPRWYVTEVLEEFARRILFTGFSFSAGGRFTAWYEDDDMFWGHAVTVDGTLKKGPVDADIQG